LRSEEELRRLLPPAPQPQGGYLPAVAHRADGAGLVVTAGMTPRVAGALQHRGQVGADVDLDEARQAAAIAVENALSAALAALPPEGRLDRVLRLTVYVNAVTGFTEHSAVADGASARLVELLGEAGGACRSAVGVASLPGGACVELELTCAWRPA
jgi:enamine deaminase RidA (YjgF/YER057c/UK114 family)